ncbi:hypothetical protein MON38_22155 [Hymenobacter sp. DH14]|uniref:Uncharacterized protein n=1 Tax=Hymenobacter cyanobacteriorum TaxID=2926463 RepID=A0A9X1VK46_9BACT|nr:hypothetical protein [Hymenobacter cyanobacteriorum]MCI1190138.1 hypothetical protein [Hymenobacter cyanobacteriorum]
MQLMLNFPRPLVSTLLCGIMLFGCKSTETPQPAPIASTIKVSISEAGAPPYDLNEARVVSANYQTGGSSLSISGKLNNGKQLLLDFSRAGTPTAYTTNALEGTLDGTTGTNSIGATTYNTQTRTVTGNFRSTFPVVGEVSGSFSGITVQ